MQLFGLMIEPMPSGKICQWGGCWDSLEKKQIITVTKQLLNEQSYGLPTYLHYARYGNIISL